MPRIQLARWILPVVAATMMVAACDRDDHARETERPAPNDSTTHQGRTAAQYSVVFQLTGQLMILPDSGGETYALLPLKPASIHYVRLGFGIPKPPNTPSYANTLCDTSRTFGAPAIKVGICYVDLRRWRVGTIGTGGTTATVAKLAQQHLPDLSGATGNHRVRIGSFPADSMIVFGGGGPGQSCSLGEWDFRPAGASNVELANELDWIIKVNQGTVFTLSFTRTGEAPVAVQPLAGSSGNVLIILANVMSDELQHLPPGKPPVKVPDPADNEIKQHFDAYYNLLTYPTPLPTNDIDYRPRPLFKGPLVGCGLDVSPLVVPPAKRASVGTYACMPATALRYP